MDKIVTARFFFFSHFDNRKFKFLGDEITFKCWSDKINFNHRIRILKKKVPYK